VSPRRTALVVLTAVLATTARPAEAGVTLRQRFDAADAASTPWFVGANNDSGTLAWGASYVMLSYVVMYDATGDAAYLDRLCELGDRVLLQRDSVRGVTAYDGQAEPCWQAASYSTQPMCWAVHTGLIAQPLVELKIRVDARPALAGRPTYDGHTLGEKAATYLQAGRDAAAVHDAEWRNDGASSGYFVFPADATFYSYAGQEMPLNQMNGMGLLLLALADATGETGFRDRATRLANHLLANLEVTSAGTYRWNYWGGTYAAPGEDISHAAINVLLAVRAAQTGVVFGAAHLARFARTFVDQIVVDTATTYDCVGGTGATNGSSYRPQAGHWAVLGDVDPSVHAYVRQLFDGFAPPLSGSVLLGLAYLAATDLYLQPYRFYVVDWNDLGDRRQATAYGANVLTSPPDPAAPHLVRLRYSAARRTEVQQWDGAAYHTVLRLAATGGSVATSYIPYHPEVWFDYSSGALFQFADSFVAGEGIVVMEPEELHPPSITSTPPSFADPAVPLTYQATATGDAPLRWSLAGPTGAVVDAQSGAVSWTPPAPGDYAFQLAVENDTGRAVQAWTLVVVPYPGDDAGVPAGDAGDLDDAAAPADAARPLDAPADAGDASIDGGCGCRAGGSSAPAVPALLVVIALLPGKRRRWRKE
jgi:MYXO-CTERM domain-containing protein